MYEDLRLVLLKKNVDYLTASSLVQNAGLEMPSNMVLDYFFAQSERWSESEPKIYSCWAREFLVHPEEGKTFQKGVDVKDSEINWVLPASCIPPKAIDFPDAALFVDPKEIVPIGKFVALIPAKTTLIYPIPKSGDWGIMEEKTGVPLADDSEYAVYDTYARRFNRTDGSAVRPIVRGVSIHEGKFFSSVRPDLQTMSAVGVQRV